MKEPVDHILRPSLPWRSDPPMTECGLNSKSVKTLTREQFAARRKEYGEQRTAILTCMTCSQTTERYTTWEEDPRRALEREIQWEGSGYWRSNNERGVRLRDELKAMAVLVERHREEFDEIIKAHAAQQFFAEEGAKKKVARPTEESPGEVRNFVN